MTTCKFPVIQEEKRKRIYEQQKKKKKTGSKEFQDIGYTSLCALNNYRNSKADYCKYLSDFEFITIYPILYVSLMVTSFTLYMRSQDCMGDFDNMLH